MVKGNTVYKSDNPIVEQEAYNIFPDLLKSTSVKLSEIISNKIRFEASSYSIDAKVAIDVLNRSKYKPEKLFPNAAFVQNAYHAARFKRNYLEKGTPNTIGFLGSAEMLSVQPKATKYIPVSQAIEKKLLVKKHTVLLSCSGTIGKMTFVSRTLEKFAFSQHVIRLECDDFPGYVYAYLNHKIAQDQIQSLIYGAVIPEIEPEHLEKILIPNPPISIKKEINDLIISSYDLRDQGNDLLDEAEKILYEELELPPIESLRPLYYKRIDKLRTYVTKLSELRLRLDGSYHVPIVKCVETEISKNCKEITPLVSLCNKIILAGVFKRTYVDENNGVHFLGGRDITQLNPKIEKFLSRTVHKARIKKELEVFQNYILISDRGTIGKVQIVPKHWEGWTVSQNIIKLVPESKQIAGYLYCFLNSDYGQILIKRETYGSVVDMIDDKNTEGIQIPLLKNLNKQSEINSLVLKANDLRYEAFLKEDKAFKLIDSLLS